MKSSQRDQSCDSWGKLKFYPAFLPRCQCLACSSENHVNYTNFSTQGARLGVFSGHTGEIVAREAEVVRASRCDENPRRFSRKPCRGTAGGCVIRQEPRQLRNTAGVLMPAPSPGRWVGRKQGSQGPSRARQPSALPAAPGGQPRCTVFDTDAVSRGPDVAYVPYPVVRKRLRGARRTFSSQLGGGVCVCAGVCRLCW